MKLQFAYAASQGATMPPVVDRALTPGQWQISSYGFDTIENLTTPPDLMWVNFGKKPKLRDAENVLKQLASLQQSTGKHAFYFVSSSALPLADHDLLASRIYATLPNPSEVVADLVGRPDLKAAVIKFLAQRNAETTRVLPPARLRVPAVHIPNADLRSGRGRLSIKLIAELFGMDAIEIGRLIGYDKKAAISKTPDSEALQELLQPFADIALLRAPDFGDEQFRKWLNASNEHMRNRSPIQWIRDGRVADVAGFVYGILTGQPA